MKTIHTWLDEYGASHQNPVNKKIHRICVPLIMVSLIGLLWSIPVPHAFEALPVPLNWAVLFMLITLCYYAVLSWRLTVGMVFMAVGLAAVSYGLDRISDPKLWQISVAIFVVAWIGQFIGHKIEGKQPSFLKDLHFLLIGPLWVLGSRYRSLGIRY
ncbi:MAG: DUF962 domain-containing protein [Bacteroidota bacterium]